MTKPSLNVLVVGAGMVGLSFAALLSQGAARKRVNIQVVDAGAEPVYSFDDDISLRVSALSSGTHDILHSTGVWPLLAQDRMCPYEEMRVWDAGGAVEGPETLRFSAAEHAVPELGHIVENKLVQCSLLDKLEGEQPTVRFNTQVQSMVPDGDRFSVVLSDGEECRCDLLVGADGGDSFVRGQAAITVNAWAYAQTALVAHLTPEVPHQHTAWQRFVADGPVALLPLADGRVSTVWSTTPERAAAAMQWSDDELEEAMSDATDHVLGRLVPASSRATFPLRAQYARQYVKPGVALIGDAAHSVHPLAGQGANLGFADAACLARVVEVAIGRSEAIGDFRVLRRYERERKGANLAMLYFVDGLNRLFARQHPALRSVRAAGMRLFNRSGPLRERAVSVALGVNS